MKKKYMVLSKENNLNVIKFICAIAVIFHHCFPITFGPDYIDPIKKVTNSQFSFGNFSVTIFMFIAGLLIALSYINTKSNFKFLIKRIKRLLPSLIIVIMVTVFIIGPIFTTVGIKEYFLNINTYKYFIFNCFLITNHNLPVFLNNAYNLSPNGALWTLPVEFCCYIGIIILGSIHFLKAKVVKFFPIIIIIVNSFQFLIIKYIAGLWPALQAILFFGMGIWVYFNYKKIKLSSKFLIIDLLLIIISLMLNFYSYINIVLIPYLVVYIAYGTKYIKFLNNLGNYSYEIYLLGFLIQQCVADIYIGKNPYINFFVSLPIIFILSVFVNKLVEFIIKKCDKKNSKL